MLTQQQDQIFYLLLGQRSSRLSTNPTTGTNTDDRLACSSHSPSLMTYQPLQYPHESKGRLPRLRDLPARLAPILTPVRLLYLAALSTLLWMFFGSFIPAHHHSLEKYYCFGPPMTPTEMSSLEYAYWNRHTDVAPGALVNFNTHVAVDVSNTSSISHFNLNAIQSSPSAADNNERVLILSPLKDAAGHLPKYADVLAALSYPHELIDLGFLVSDTKDDTLAVLTTELNRIQAGPKPFNSINIYKKDFGSSDDTASRQRAMARARNYLLQAALKPHHSWVMWRDVDVVESSKSIIEDFARHDRDIIVPNVWVHTFEGGVDKPGRFDYKSWVDSPRALSHANTLPKDALLDDSKHEFGRRYMCLEGDAGASDTTAGEIDLDGVGGVTIIVKADVHRSGINFPAYSFENHCETEGFAKMAKRAGYRVVGLPNYIVWHADDAKN